MSQVSGLRGGAVVVSGEGTEEDADSFEDLDDDDFDDGMMNEEDFGEANFVDRLKQDWRKTPIITRTFFQVTRSPPFRSTCPSRRRSHQSFVRSSLSERWLSLPCQH